MVKPYSFTVNVYGAKDEEAAKIALIFTLAVRRPDGIFSLVNRSEKHKVRKSKKR